MLHLIFRRTQKILICCTIYTKMREDLSEIGIFLGIIIRVSKALFIFSFYSSCIDLTQVKIYADWKLLINFTLDILFHNFKYSHECITPTMPCSFHLKLFCKKSNKVLNYKLMTYIFYQCIWLCRIRLFWTNQWTEFFKWKLTEYKNIVFVVWLETCRELFPTSL